MKEPKKFHNYIDVRFFHGAIQLFFHHWIQESHPVATTSSHLLVTLLSSPDNNLPLPNLTYKKYQSFITYGLHNYQPAHINI